MKVILEGIVGSKAYGLDTPESDTDIKGVMVYPTEKILSLQKGKETLTQTKPDIEYHEVEKFIRLAAKCNPTILEMLYLDKYTKITAEGNILLSIREHFLSKKVSNTYAGYAIHQAKKLYKKAKSGNKWARHEKHSRHVFRLLFQGKELLETGNLTVRVENPEIFFRISKIDVDGMMSLFEEKLQEFNETKTSLPDEPNYKEINSRLLQIRGMNYGTA